MKLIRPTKKIFLYFFLAAFCIRAALFYFYIQHEERYYQADSMDYHNCAVGIVFGTGMHRADNLKPIFWRTPGYPVLLAAAYKLCGMSNSRFDANHFAQKLFLWLQIVACSFTPIVLFLLAFLLTQSLLIAYILALIGIMHPGYVLASTYMLTEGIAVLLFYLFLLFFYASYRAYGEKKDPIYSWFAYILYAALALGCYTWIRPMGEFVAVVAVGILLCTAISQWRLKLKKAVLFITTFAICLMPWYIRNYQLTGQLFFCPMSGAYLNSFTAPKVLRAVKNISLEKAIGLCYQLASQETRAEQARNPHSPYIIPRELIAKRIALPVLYAYPFQAAYEWIKEVFKTTFDLYASQWTALATNCFKYDPLEEFLLIKWSDNTWHAPMPCWMRILTWLEIVYMLLLWIGLLAGFWQLMLFPLYLCISQSKTIDKLCGLWCKIAPMIWAVLFMTGGFGYARLRLPVEPLMCILSLTWWYMDKNTMKK